MPIEVRVGSVLRKKLNNARSVPAQGDNVRQVMEDLERRYPGFKSQIITENGELQQFINIFVNDEDIRFLDGLDTKVEAGSIITILPAVAGGTE